MWNVSQNVPSAPIECTVDSSGKAIDCPLCTQDGSGISDCNEVVPFASVSIPITTPVG